MIPGYTLEWMMKSRYRCFVSPCQTLLVLAFKDRKPGSKIKVLYSGNDEQACSAALFRHVRLYPPPPEEDVPESQYRAKPCIPVAEDWREDQDTAVGTNGDV